MAYFDTLNYTLANEDTKIEYDLLENNLDKVFCICGSGSRVLPLIAKNPKVIDIVDISETQLYLVELRIEAAKKLSYEEFLFFMGYRGATYSGPSTGDNRYALFLRLDLSERAKNFWEMGKDKWIPHGFILLGRWENHFQKLGFLLRSGLRMNARPIFEAHSLEEQVKLYNKHWNKLVFRNFLRLVANEFVFNKFLYKGHFAGSKNKKTDPRAPWQFLDDQFKHLFTTTLVRKSYFLQVLFLGKIYFEEGLPLEAQPHIVEQIKKSTTKFNFKQGDLLTQLKEEAYDFVSLSDTISYLAKDDVENILQKLSLDIKTESKVVIRSFLKAPTAPNLSGWNDEVELNKWAYNSDCTGVYKFHIYSKK